MKIFYFLCMLPLCLWLSPALAQQTEEQLTIAGTVVDSKGQPISKVSIYVKDKPKGATSTDDKGKFTIKAVYGDWLVFTSVGYDVAEHLVVESTSNLELKMLDKSTNIDEVVVVGLGAKQRKISSVGAITTVDVKQLQSPAPSIANMLGGRAAGIISMQTSGEPGANIADFWVRGIGTFGANAKALVLIDGLEGDLNTIDPADVESFSILKDASATAVYGVRGANGVVLVTTKRGTVDRIQITGRANSTLSRLNRLPKYLRAYDYALLANEASVVRGSEPLFNDTELGIIQQHLDPDMYPDVSWQDEILNRSFWRQSYYASGRGGSEVARYFLSLGGNSETAAYKVDKNSIYSSNVGYNTYNYRVNLDINLTKTTKVFLGSDGFLSVKKEPGYGNTDDIWKTQSTLTPISIPLKYSNGLLPGVGSGQRSSPYVMINRTGNYNNQNYKGKVTLALDQDLSSVLEGLKIRGQGAYDIQSYFSERRWMQPALYEATGRNLDGSLIMVQKVQERPASYSKFVSQYRKYHFESTLNYDKKFGEDHRTSALVYYYLSDAKNTDDATNNLTAIPVRYQGVSSRFTYGYKDTYLLDANFGYTGSENFQPGRQYGFFPSVAIGWVPTSYQFMKNVAPWLDYFKIRASYGTVGNDRIVDDVRFPYLTKADIDRNKVWGIDGIETITETRIGADNLAWERAIKSNLGIEGKLFNNKIDFVIDFFQDQRNGIFQPRVQVPDYVGVISNPYANVGRMKSSGADGNISYTTKLNSDMTLTLRGNFTYSKNVVQNWEQAYLEYSYLEYNGYPHNSIRGYQALGLFKDEDDIKYSPTQSFGTVLPGDIKYKDVNGDGIINTLDKVPLTHSNYPLIMYGFGGEFRYKNLSLGVLFKGTGKTSFFYVGQPMKYKDVTENTGMGYMPFFGGTDGNVITMANDPANRWIPRDYALQHGIDLSLAENPNAKFPRLQYGNNRNNSQLSSFWMDDARYLRLQELTLSYNVSPNFLKRLGVKSMDLQFVGNNLYIWDNVKIFDPEQAAWGGRKYPIPTTYSLQAYINF
ncbi:SusC/RagA family TonB-linked outer membrane protein [Sphingobacterium multivorum]|uniref:TonB-linked outer membrane protein, SusC/RagA family n=3 Tax=Sphingobacterium multivorum TaxID=28454 RepID=A0A2X2J008_SPHMU|nr:TonB-dependent receptor [Sphingobacterium multivorum]QRQ59642.1 TonB-dependent receptor [Sphingobacterium multivorum]SPZ84946.1 TonB-linked outer membrane protein, SusC/RagA family [Sphingobacterium multivorum]